MNNYNKFLTAAAVISLIIVLVVGYLIPADDMHQKIIKALPQAENFAKVETSPLIFKGTVEKNRIIEKVGYVVVDEAAAYGGPIQIITGIDMKGNIVEVLISEHKDTPSFIRRVLDHKYLEQFPGKSVTDSISLNEDIDGVSGATFSSRGIAKAVSHGSHAVAESQFNFNINEKAEEFKFGFKEGIIAFLIILMIIGVKFKLKKLRWVTLLGGLIFIGFKYSTPISLGNIASVFMGFFPSIRENLVWYMLLIGIPVITFAFGKNIYCFWLCPFGAVQELTAKLGSGKYKCCNKKIESKAKKIKYILVYIALLGAFLLRSPGFAGFEPFSALFSQQGTGIQWLILPLVLFTSLFIYRFWCRYFCPVWVANEVIWKLSRYIKKEVNEWKKKNKALEK